MSDGPKMDDRLAPVIRSRQKVGERFLKLPHQSNPFVGREEALASLENWLVQNRQSPVVALSGVGGVGKTSLAVEFARRAISRFQDGVIFLNMTNASARDAMGKVIQNLAPTVRLPEDEQELAALYKGLLEGKEILLVFDDIESSEQLEALIPPSPAAAVATTRRYLGLPDRAVLHLGELQLHEAINLLRAALEPERHLEERDLVTLAQACGLHPLALRMAAQSLRLHPSWTVTKLLNDMASLPSANASNAPPLRVLLEQQLDALSSSGLPLCTWLKELAVFPSNFSASAAQAVWQTSADDARVALEEFSARSLIEVTSNDPDRRYYMHDLVRGWLVEAFQSEVVSAKARHAKHYLNVLEEVARLHDEQQDAASAFKLFDLEHQNIEAGQMWARTNSPGLLEAAHLAIGYGGTCVEVTSARLAPREWVRWLEAAVSAYERLGDRLGEAYALGNLGVAWIKQGELPRALPYLELCLRAARDVGNRVMEANALGPLGHISNSLGETEKAISLFSDQLGIAREIGDLATQADALGNLGLVYASTGKQQLAIESLERQLALARDLGMRLTEANALGNLALQFSSVGDTNSALEYLNRQLLLSRQLGDRRGEASALSNSGSISFARGDLETATMHYEVALQIVRELGDRRGEARLIGNLGNVYLAAGQHVAAMEAYAQQITICRSIGDRIGEGNALWNSALVMEIAGDLKSAIVSAQAALQVRQAIGDPNAVKTSEWLAKRVGNRSSGRDA
jgi:tetratricopeptide (TPR) repeat protein